jgi:hypothetical protein
MLPLAADAEEPAEVDIADGSASVDWAERLPKPCSSFALDLYGSRSRRNSADFQVLLGRCASTFASL